MAKLTRPDTRLHEQACELVESDRPLTIAEREFVLDNWNPMANHNVTVAGAFFTPKEWASAMITPYPPDGRIIDFCAGIGRLGFTMWCYNQEQIRHYSEEKPVEIVCLEINPEYVKVGKRVLPEAEWIEANGYDQDVVDGLGHFDRFYANPPFGNVATVNGNAKWLVNQGKGAHGLAVEIGARLSDVGVMIIPEGKTDYNAQRGEHQLTQSVGSKVRKLYPDFNINPWLDRTSIFTEEGEAPDWKGADPKCEIVKYSITQ
jgi:hypothetical protein